MEERPFLECHRRVVEKATLLVRLEPVRVQGTRYTVESGILRRAPLRSVCQTSQGKDNKLTSWNKSKINTSVDRRTTVIYASCLLKLVLGIN